MYSMISMAQTGFLSGKCRAHANKRTLPWQRKCTPPEKFSAESSPSIEKKNSAVAASEENGAPEFCQNAR
jgi:hypothetical protein